MWVGDITYVPTQEGWLYLAAALAQALHQRQPAAGACITPTGASQYASATYRQQVGAAGLLPSMSRAGNCYDNAAMESFWGRLKTELVHRRKFASRAEARLAIFEYVEVFYNQVRLHSALGYKSPVDFEHQLN